MLDDLIARLTQRENLSTAHVRDAVGQLVDEAVPAETKADFLTALARKGETPDEIAAFAAALREMSIQPALPPQLRAQGILDVVGTGGDRAGSFNISTGAALVAAAAGATVAKHGNRAVTSKTGSADVLEALGVPIDLDPAAVVEALARHRFAFLFAPRYHPAFRHIAPARKLCAARGQRTLFNFLGPLLNPVRPSAQLMGVPRPEWCEPLARVLQSLGVRRGLVVCGQAPPESTAGAPDAAAAGAWLDEISTVGETTVAEFHHERGFHLSTLPLTGFTLQPATIDDLRGGDRETNAHILRGVLSGEDRGPRREAVLLNAGAALFVADLARSITEGWERAAATIDTGEAARTLEALRRPAGPA